MSEKNKARLGAATPERAKDRQTYTDTATNPAYKSTTPAGAGQRSIADLLGVGRENAIPRRDLERLTGLDGRGVRLLIERERRAGTPILADSASGYFFARIGRGARRVCAFFAAQGRGDNGDGAGN